MTEAARVHWDVQIETARLVKTVWPSGLRRWLKAPVRKGVGSNPTAVIYLAHKRGGLRSEFSTAHKRWMLASIKCEGYISYVAVAVKLGRSPHRI